MALDASIGTLVVAVIANASQYRKTMKSLEGTTEATMHQIVKTVKYAGAAIATTMAIIGTAAVREAAKFESSFAGVRKTVNATEEEFRRLEEEFRSMAKQIPINVNEINRIGEAAGQLGIQREHLTRFVRVMADLGVATNMTSDQAATALARLANITQMPQSEFERLGSTIVDLGNNFATTESEITEMSLRIAGAGAQVGLTNDQILALSAALSSVGIAAEAGGSSISRTMIKIANAVAQGGAQLESFASVAGMTADDFAQRWEQDAAGALLEFIEGLDRMAKSGANVFGVLEQLEITQIRERDALLRAAGAGDLFRRSLELSAKAWEENSALSEEAAKRYATFESQVSLLLNQLRDAFITIGQELIPVLQVLIGYINDASGESDGFRDAIMTVAHVIKTVLVTAINVVSDTIYGWQLLLKGLQVVWAVIIDFFITSFRKWMGMWVGGLTRLEASINSYINAWNDLTGATQRNVDFTQGLVNFTLSLGNTTENTADAVADLKKEFMDLVAKGRPSERFMQDLEEREMELANANKSVVKTQEAVNEALEETGQTIANAVTPELIEFQQFMRGGFDDAFTQIAKFNHLLDTGQITLEERNRAMRDVLSQTTPFIAPVEGLMEFTGIDQVDRFAELHNQERLLEEQFLREREIMLSSTETTQEMLLEMEAAYAARREELRQAQTHLLLTQSSDALGALSDSLRDALGEQSGAYKAMFAASKAFAIADAIISINQGIASAWKLGWPAAIPAMASVISSTAGLISNIQAVALSFEGGGYTPSGPRVGGVDGRGGFYATLHPDERVIDLTKEEDLVARSGGTVVNVNQTFTGGVTEADLAREAQRIKRETMAAIPEAISRGGSYRKAVQR